MNKRKRFYCRIIAVATSCMMAVPVSAAPTITEESGYDAETLQKLQDNTIEYGELGNLIHEANPTVQNIWDSINDTKQEMIDTNNEMKRLRGLMNSSMTDAKKNNDFEAMAYYAIQAGTFDAIAKGYDKGLKAFDKPSTTKQVDMVEKQLTMYAQTAMIGYNTIKANIGTLQKMKDLYQAQYDLRAQMAAQGMATQTEVLAAQAQVLEAESTLLSMQSTLETTGRTLAMMLGWGADESPEIALVPEADYSRMEAMDPGFDLQKAIWNNQTLISIRNQSATTTTARNEKRRSEEDGETKLAIELQRLYDDMQQKKLAYEASLTGYEAAKISRASVETQYNLGMLGRAEYFAAQLSYLQKEAATQAANIALLQAIENYEWAVFGFADITE